MCLKEQKLQAAGVEGVSEMRRMTPLLSLLASAALALGALVAPTSATADDGKCDPANGKYVCDGTDSQPEGSKPKEKKRPKPPATGVSTG